jgi:hypothetical protein
LTAAKPLCQFDAFASAIKASGFDHALESELGIAPNCGIVELLDAISNHIAKSMRGKPKACFSKSVKETLYTTLTDPEDPDVENFKRCVTEFVRCEGTGRLVQGLFQFYVFNSVWSEAEDGLREAEGGESLEELWRRIELLCAAAVAQVLRERQNEQSHELLKPKHACELLLQIQSRLGELCSPKPFIAKASVSDDKTMLP